MKVKTGEVSEELQNIRDRIKILTGRISTLNLHISYCQIDLEQLIKQKMILVDRERLYNEISR